MANVINSVDSNSSLDYSVYIKPLLDSAAISALPFDLLYGKFKSRDIYFNTDLDKIAVKKVACGWDFKGGAEFTKKTVTPVEISASVEQCYTPLVETIFAQGLPDGWERGTLSPEVRAFMLEQRNNAFSRDLASILFLGDDSLNDDYYEIMDGIYKKLAAGAVAVDGTVDAGAVASGDVDTTNFYTTLKAIYNSRTSLMRQLPKTNLQWIWTEAVYDAYIDYLETKTQSTAGVIQRDFIENGITTNKLFGVPITVVPIVDQRLNADFLTGSPAEPTDPYRIILTVPSNHKIIMDGSGLTNVNQWYDPKEDTYYMAGSALLAYEYGYGELNVIAGF